MASFGGSEGGKGGSESLTTMIAREIADREGVSPVSMTPPLGHVVDTDALESLFSNSRAADLEVTFEYKDYEVTLKGSEAVVALTVEPALDCSGG